MAAKPKRKPETSGPAQPPRNVGLQSELESRFLAYALSTIVSRALPDVRDGLKPVHRRVLYSMYQLKLGHASRFRKSAAVVGDVIGKYHPHGDQAAYDTLARLAQDFSLRYPLIEGQGNFGNVDGDRPAAMRYTEARLSKIADEMLRELKKDTVDFAPTYDAVQDEPTLLPARFPNLLVNGSAGIAVGIATNIPPHNLAETIDALIALIDNPQLETKDLLKYIKGPDFPTGGLIIASKDELREVYQTGRGPVKVRGEWSVEKQARGKWVIVVSSIPYTVNKSSLLERIGDLVLAKKLPSLVDVRDESTEIIRVVLEPKSQTVDAGAVMSYLFKHTDLQVNFNVNLTALTKSAKPVRHSLEQILKSFLEFRYEITCKRLNYDLRIIEERLRVLVALARVYNDLDAAIAIIRKSKTRDEARRGLMKRFKLDQTQANAILDLRLAALVGLEISNIRKEKVEKEAEAELLRKVLASKSRLWKLTRKELKEIKDEYSDERRTKIITGTKADEEYDPEVFIEHEDTNVIVSRDGWVRRVKTVTSPEALRFKNGDGLMAWLTMNTRDLVCFFTSTGKMFAIRVMDIIQTTGFGDPVQSIFKFADMERIVSVVGVVRQVENKPGQQGGARAQGGLFDQIDDKTMENVYGSKISGACQFIIGTEEGMGFVFSSEMLAETNRNGKKIASLKGDDAVLDVMVARKEMLFTLSSDGRGLIYPVKEIPSLSGPGRGARLMKLKPGARLMGFRNVGMKDRITLAYSNGKDDIIKVAGLAVGSRGTVGRVVGARRKKLAGMLKG